MNMKTILSTSDNWEYVTSEQYAIDNDSEYNEDDLDYDMLSGVAQMFYEEDLSCISWELQDFIKRYEKRYKTSVVDVVFLGGRSSHYGSIGGAGASVGISAGGTDIQEMYFNANDIEYGITDGFLTLRTFDHDGSNFMEMILVTQNEQDKAEVLGLDIREYLDDAGKSPTKLDSTFLKAFGYKVSKQTA